MLRCMICETCSPDNTATCPACGEASWAQGAADKAAPQAEEPMSTAEETSPKSRRRN